MNLKLFKKRLIALYSCWRNNKRTLWGNSDVLVICTPPPPSDSSAVLSHPISSSFFFWLLGHDFPDTIAIFTRNEIYFLCPKKKFSILQTLGGPAMEAADAQVTVHPKSKGEDGLELMDRVIRGIRVRQRAKADSDENQQPLVVGYISGESPKSNLFWGCFKNVKSKKFRIAQVNGFSRLLNLDQDVEKRDSELCEDYSSKVIPMQSLPHSFEQMLSLTPEGRSETPHRADDKNLQFWKENDNPPVGLPGMAETPSRSSVSDGEDEWVLVEADGKEQYMGERDKATVWMMK